MVRFNLKIVGVINRLIQLLVIGYVIIWVLAVQKGYQLTERGVTAVTTQVHGIAHSLSPNELTEGVRTWDVVDTVVPAEENKAFFVTTSALVTQNQTQSICAEHQSVAEAKCSNDSDCPIGKPYQLGNGVSTGSCCLQTNTCYVRAWCPLEDNTESSRVILTGVENFSVLIKSRVLFPDNNVRASNVANWDSSYLNTCRYNATTDPFCPVFTVRDLIKLAVADNPTVAPVTLQNMTLNGAVMIITVKWDCNLDFAIENCYPTYIFNWLNVGEEVQGYNYLYAHWYTDNDVRRRQLIRAYGILFITNADAEAGKFDLLSTTLNIGSGLALLSIARVICNFVIFYLCNRRGMFSAAAYETVGENDPVSRREYLDLDHPFGLDLDT